MNRRLHAGAVALACLGVLLLAAGYLGWKGVPDEPFMCGDAFCEEAHP